MASKYNNLTRLYRLNIQRKNSVGRKPARQATPPLVAQSGLDPAAPPAAAVASTTQR